MAALGRSASVALRPRKFAPPVTVSTSNRGGWNTSSTRTFPLQPHAISSKSIQTALEANLGPRMSMQELQWLEERTSLAPENIQQLESIFHTLAGTKRHLDFKAFEAGLPLVQTLQDGGLCPETYLSAFQAFDLDRSGTIEVEVRCALFHGSVLLGVTRLFRCLWSLCEGWDDE
jgi:hypothetical protein